MKKKVWVKPELKNVAKPIETVFVWTSGTQNRPDYDVPAPQQMVFLTRVKEFFFGKNKAIA